MVVTGRGSSMGVLIGKADAKEIMRDEAVK
jgi:hypothetical protein